MAAESRRALGVPSPQACSLHSEQETGQGSQDGYPSVAEIKAFITMPSVHSAGDEILATPQLLTGAPTLSHTPSFIVFKYRRSMKSLGSPEMSVHKDQSALPSRSLPPCSLYENTCHMLISHMSIKYIYLLSPLVNAKSTNWNPLLQSDLALLNILFLKVHLWGTAQTRRSEESFQESSAVVMWISGHELRPSGLAALCSVRIRTYNLFSFIVYEDIRSQEAGVRDGCELIC